MEMGDCMRLSDFGKANLLRLMDLARGDLNYREMMGEFRALDSRMRQVMEEMEPESQQIVGAYLAVVAQAGRHMVDLACEHMSFLDQ